MAKVFVKYTNLCCNSKRVILPYKLFTNKWKKKIKFKMENQKKNNQFAMLKGNEPFSTSVAELINELVD